MQEEPPKRYHDICVSCLRHTTERECCCQLIAHLQDKVKALEDVNHGNERFISSLVNVSPIDDRQKAEWLEVALSAEKIYIEDLENVLIDVQTENWLCREALQSFGIESKLPLLEGIIELSKRNKKMQNDFGEEARKRFIKNSSRSAFMAHVLEVGMFFLFIGAYLIIVGLCIAAINYIL